MAVEQPESFEDGLVSRVERSIYDRQVSQGETESVRLSDGAFLWTRSQTTPGLAGVVFVHGGPGMWDYLAPVAGSLVGLASTHRYDQRGCGRSSPDENYLMSRFVADLDELCTYFGYRRWFVVGHSFGATLGLEYASAHPGRVAGLVYCGGVGLDWAAHRATARACADARLTELQRARREQLDKADRSWDEEVEWRSLCWSPDFADRDRAEAMAQADAVTPLALNLACSRALMQELGLRSNEDERAACRRVTAPVLVIHGSEDPRPIAGISSLIEALPTAELRLVEGAGHQPWREQPDMFGTVIREFILANEAVSP